MSTKRIRYNVRKKIQLVFTAVLMMNVCVADNTQATPAPLNVGDILPDNIVLSNSFNYPGGKIPLKDFRGKLLLIDFWSTWCSSCIEGFSKLHKLQETFNNRLQVVLVNTERGDTEQKVSGFFQRRQQRTGTTVTLPYVLQDSVLSAFFPHQSVPHYAWISATGKVIAITSAEEVTVENIRSILNGSKTTLRTKKDQLDFDEEKPLFVDGNGGNGITPLYRSMITGYIDGISTVTGGRRNAEGQWVRYFSYNKPPLKLLREAFGDLILYPNNRVVVEDNNIAHQQIKHSDASDIKDLYCYELVMPPGTRDQVLSTMRSDLLKAFNLAICNEKRKVTALVLTASNNITITYTKGGKSEALFEKDRVHKYLRNYAVKDMLWLINNASAMPVIDETGVMQNIDMDLPEDMTSEEQWIKALQKAGFITTVGEREMEMTVIKSP